MRVPSGHLKWWVIHRIFLHQGEEPTGMKHEVSYKKLSDSKFNIVQAHVYQVVSSPRICNSNQLQKFENFSILTMALSAAHRVSHCMRYWAYPSSPLLRRSRKLTERWHDYLFILCYAPINITPHYPPPGRYRWQHRGIDIENQAPDRGIWHACIRYLSNPLSFPHPGRGIEWGFDRWGWPHLMGSWRVH